MFDRITRFALLAAHQTTLALGILLMPVALLARQAGVSLPFGSLVERTQRAYQRAT
jgi:hypothetical protein